jgi:quinoprotein glucose dehydrogenase
MGLAGVGNLNALAGARTDPSAAVRRGALLGLRRLQHPECAGFLADADDGIVLEAARAIYDEPIPASYQKLADLLRNSGRWLTAAESAMTAGTDDGRRNRPVTGVEAAVSEVRTETGYTTPAHQLMERLLAVNHRLGTGPAAEAVARFATNEAAPAGLRTMALELLGNWADPSGRDTILGTWRPSFRRDPAAARAPIAAVLRDLLRARDDSVRLAAIRQCGRLRLSGAAGMLESLVLDRSTPGSIRAACVEALAAVGTLRIDEIIRTALGEADTEVRLAAMRIEARRHPAEAVATLEKQAAAGDVRSRQAALAILGQIPGVEADRVVAGWMERLQRGEAPPELQLDVLNAAGARQTPAFLAQLKRYADTRPKTQLGSYLETLHGGDAAAGRRIFSERLELGCIKCHKVGGEGGDAGPDLTGIGKRKTREYLLESILFPNNHLAEGFENLLLVMKDGASHAGRLVGETAEVLTLDSPEDGRMEVRKQAVKTRIRALSAMPEEFRQILGKADLRDVIAYLTGL